MTLSEKGRIGLRLKRWKRRRLERKGNVQLRARARNRDEARGTLTTRRLRYRSR